MAGRTIVLPWPVQGPHYVMSKRRRGQKGGGVCEGRKGKGGPPKACPGLPGARIWTSMGTSGLPARSKTPCTASSIRCAEVGPAASPLEAAWSGTNSTETRSPFPSRLSAPNLTASSRPGRSAKATTSSTSAHAGPKMSNAGLPQHDQGTTLRPNAGVCTNTADPFSCSLSAQVQQPQCRLPDCQSPAQAIRVNVAEHN